MVLHEGKVRASGPAEEHCETQPLLPAHRRRGQRRTTINLDQVRRVLNGTYRIPLRPQQGANLWQNLRTWFTPYLLHSQPGEPTGEYTELRVDREVERVVTSPRYRNIELEVDPSRMEATFKRSLVGLTFKNTVVRDVCVEILLRHAHAHLDHESEFVVPVFHGVMAYLGKALEEGRHDDSALAAHTLCHVTPYLPIGFDRAPQLGEMLRPAIMGQHVDILPFIWAYHGLAHALTPENMEMTEGVAMFKGLAGSSGRDDIVTAAIATVKELASVGGNVKGPASAVPLRPYNHRQQLKGGPPIHTRSLYARVPQPR